MDKKWKKKWVAALRSGKYKQARQYLNLDGRFCCLGVLCDLYNPNCWIDNNGYKEYNMPDSLGRKNPKTQRGYAMPPRKLAEKLGLKWISMEKLSKLNDNGLSFKQIADIIERDL